MTTLSVKVLSAIEAGELISEVMGVSGLYYLVDNRRGKHKYTIPYYTKYRKVYYLYDDIERFILAYKPTTKATIKTLKKVELSEDVWLMGPSLSDEGEPIVEIARGAGMEILTPDDARNLGIKFIVLADEAEALLMKAA